MENGTVDLARERAKRADDNRDVTPEQLMEQALEELRAGEEHATALVILRRHDDPEDDTFGIGWWAANARGSDIIALMEMVKATILRDQGLT